MSKSPFFRKTLIGTACFGVVAGLGFLLGAMVRPVAVQAQAPGSSSPSAMPSSSDPASVEGTGTLSAVPATTTPYVDAAPNVGVVGIAPRPDLVPPPFTLPITFLRDPRYGHALDLLKQNGVPIENVLNPSSTAHPSAIVERLISLSNVSPGGMAKTLPIINEILERGRREFGGDASYRRKISEMQNSVSALIAGTTEAAGPATTADQGTGEVTGGSSDLARGGSTSGGATSNTGAASTLNGIYISQARLHGRIADTFMPSPFQDAF